MKKTTDKTPKPEKQRGEYDEKLQVKGSFLDIMKAAMKEADENPKRRKRKRWIIIGKGEDKKETWKKVVAVLIRYEQQTSFNYKNH